MWRCDWLAKGGFVPSTTWHTTEALADQAAFRLRFTGLANVVVWFDAAAMA